MRESPRQRKYHPGFELLEGREVPSLVLADFANLACSAAGLALVNSLANDRAEVVDRSSAGTVTDLCDKTVIHEMDERECRGAEATIAYELTLMGGAKTNDAIFVGVNGGTSPVLGNLIYADDDRDDADGG